MSTKVEVLGRVKTPGFFSFNSNLREVLDLAGGFDDPFFKQTIILDEIVVLRKDASQYYGKEFLVTYENSENLPLNRMIKSSFMKIPIIEILRYIQLKEK